MAQFGGNKNPPWAQGGRGGPPGGGAGALDVPGLVGAFGAAAGQGPPVFQGTPTGLPPGLAGVGHLGVPGAGHGPAVTLAAMAGQPVSLSERLPSHFSISGFFSCFFHKYFNLGCLSTRIGTRYWISWRTFVATATASPTSSYDSTATSSSSAARTTTTATTTN